MNRDDTVTSLVQRYHALEGVGRPREAVVPLLDALRLSPEEGWLLALASEAMLDVKETDQAVSYAEKAIAADPHSSRGYLALSRALEEKKDYPAAVEAAREAYRLFPEGTSCQRQLIDVLMEVRGFQEAEALQQRLVEAEPGDPDTWTSAAYVDWRQKRWDRMEAHLRRALSIDPEDTGALYLLGRHRLHRWRIAEAAELFSSALSVDAHDSYSSFGLELVGYSCMLLPAVVTVVATVAGWVACTRGGLGPFLSVLIAFAVTLLTARGLFMPYTRWALDRDVRRGRFRPEIRDRVRSVLAGDNEWIPRWIVCILCLILLIVVQTGAWIIQRFWP